ncbi:MAG: hypothetical protein N3G19_00525 [Candidatus Pacearchaeota archaeon]|nr:hypothetical protein [Candidatus Pacearchaeota archaeon]
MAEISNSFLALLLVVAIVVAIIGAWTSIDRVNRLATITGYQTKEGYVNVTITNQTIINVTATDCNFGSGYVTPGASYAILASNWTVIDWEGAGTSSSLRIKNDGNVNVRVDVSSGKNNTEFFGGDFSYDTYKAWSFHETWPVIQSGCKGTMVNYPGTDMDKSNKTMCTNLSVGTGGFDDEFSVGCYLEIGQDVTPGAKTDIWTFWATPVVS